MTWLAPPLVLGFGAVGAAIALRMLANATEEAQAAHRRFRRMEDALIPLRVETRRTRESVDHLRHR